MFCDLQGSILFVHASTQLIKALIGMLDKNGVWCFFDPHTKQVYCLLSHTMIYSFPLLVPECLVQLMG